jgi:triphosphatase
MAQRTRQLEAPHFAPDLSVGDGLQEMLAGALQGLRRHSTPAARSGNPETVHRFRVGVRRLRSILAAFGDAMPEKERRALGDRLHAVQQRYARAREWDVFLTDTVAPLRLALPQEQTLAELQELAAAARLRALPPGEGLKSAVAAVEAAIEESPWLRRPVPALAETWKSPLRDFAIKLLDGRHRRLRKRVKHVDLTDQTAFHQLRIRVKKLRYPAEIVKSLFDEELAADYLERLIAMQDVLGGLNDAIVARGLTGELTLPPAARSAVAGWIAHKIETCRDRFPTCGRDFRRAEPFWTG